MMKVCKRVSGIFEFSVSNYSNVPNFNFVNHFVKDLLLCFSRLEAQVITTFSNLTHSIQFICNCTQSRLITTIDTTIDYVNQGSDILQHSQNRPTGDRWLKL